MNKKYIYIGIFLLTVLLLHSAQTEAQEKKDSLVNVAFGTVLNEDLLGAVSTVNVSDLLKKNYSTYSLDGLQSFVGGYNGKIWGQDPLIMVDGVPREASDIRSSEIESISVLKGASAVVLYGSRAAKGVVLITTKRGKEQPLTIDVRANTGLYVPKSYPNYLNAADYMTLYNEACVNDGIAQKYDESLIYNTYSGTNPYRYPDIDFFSSEYLKDTYNRSDVTGEITGGNKRARYYSNFGMAYSNSLIKYGDKKNDNNLQFNIRSNVDMDLNDWLSASANVAVIVENRYAGRGDFWKTSSTLRPNWFSPLIPIDALNLNSSSIQNILANSNHIIDGKYLLGGTSTNQTNAFSDMLAAGYIKNKNRSFMFDVKVGADLARVTPGLSFKTAYSVDYVNYYNEAYKLDYAVYEPIWTNMNGADVITGLTQYNEDKNSTSEYIGETQYSQTMSFNAQFNYDRTFSKYHNVTANLIGWGYQIQKSADSNHEGSSYHRVSNANLGFQAAYNYMHKYYADFSAAVVHSAKLPEGNRNAFSPSLTLGWRISDEDFFANNVSFIDNMKLTTSYANLHQDLDIEEFYMYKGYFASDAGWYNWRDGVAGGSTTGSKRGENPDLTFVERNEFRFGVEASFLDNRVNLDANYFLQYTDGGLTQGKSTIYPAYFSNWDFSFLPNLNYNKDKRTGVDFSLNLHDKIREFEYNLGFSGMFYTTDAVRRDEVYQYDYQYREGKPLDAYWGYISEGFFVDDADIESHASQSFGVVKPGDIKYKDVNNDGVVDSKDQVNLGHNGWAAPPFTYGINLTLKWQNFTLFALATGNSGAIGFKDNSYYWVKGSSKYSEVVLGRWTEATKDVATYPRLSTTENSNNFQKSTFWQYKTNRFDLNRVQLTYDLPKQIFTRGAIKRMSVYFSGESLLTLSKERKMMEMKVGEAPQNRFFNLGVTATF